MKVEQDRLDFSELLLKLTISKIAIVLSWLKNSSSCSLSEPVSSGESCKFSIWLEMPKAALSFLLEIVYDIQPTINFGDDFVSIASRELIERIF